MGKKKNESCSTPALLAHFSVPVPICYSRSDCSGTPFTSLSLVVEVCGKPVGIPIPRPVFESFIRAAESAIQAIPGEVSVCFTFTAETPTLAERVNASKE